MDVDDFKTEMSIHMLEAWERAKANLKERRPRDCRKKQCDHRVRVSEFKPGDRVFI